MRRTGLGSYGLRVTGSPPPKTNLLRRKHHVHTFGQTRVRHRTRAPTPELKTNPPTTLFPTGPSPSIVELYKLRVRYYIFYRTKRKICRFPDFFFPSQTKNLCIQRRMICVQAYRSQYHLAACTKYNSIPVLCPTVHRFTARYFMHVRTTNLHPFGTTALLPSDRHNK